MKNESLEEWQVKWTFLITRLKQLIAEKGKEMVIMNVEAERNAERQFKRYMKTVETVRNNLDIVVTTSLPGEERIFWPYYDVQFYIRDGKEKISSTGNFQVIQQVFKVS